MVFDPGMVLIQQRGDKILRKESELSRGQIDLVELPVTQFPLDDVFYPSG